jgi:metal-responsive CopG/Arc/MetJ family transcriptional regulator
MRTVVSIPNRLAAAANDFAQQRGMTCSELYAKALSEYLQRHHEDHTTERINAALEKIPSDQFIGEGSLTSLRRLPW